MSIPSIWHVPAHLPRHAFSARDAARSGDVWRAFQEIAVEASSRAGYPPSRYREEGVAFVIRSMTVVHGREVRYGEALQGTTWVSRFRRDMLSTREVRLRSSSGVIASGTQEWVHVDASLTPVRASAEMLAAFPPEPHPSERATTRLTEPVVTADGSEHEFEFDAWFTAMDPLDHANHPAYVDYCDEAISRLVQAAGATPLALRAHAEHVVFSRGVVAPGRVRVVTRLTGYTEVAAVLAHEISQDGVLCAKATTHRSLLGDFEALGRILSD